MMITFEKVVLAFVSLTRDDLMLNDSDDLCYLRDRVCRYEASERPHAETVDLTGTDCGSAHLCDVGSGKQVTK